MNPYYPNPCPPVPNPSMSNTKRFSRQKNWERPSKTETDSINEDESKIQEKLENYVEVENIDFVSTNTHVRYRVFDTRVASYRFRLGGLLAMKHTDYVVLSNGSLTWSVPKKTEHLDAKYPTRFYRVLTPYEMQQKKAEQNRAESDEKQVVVSQQLEELERQKAEIEKLKKVIVKMSRSEALNAENQSVVTSASKQNVKGKGKNV
jgi:hypothetical protein